MRRIRENHAKSFRVEDVARLSGMSVSAFHRAFQAATPISPIRFRTESRLQEARLMPATRPGEVTAVGRRVGYDNSSRFNREYRRLFVAPRAVTRTASARPDRAPAAP
ncbi:helix-turn-helix transcriptional regulator [Streptomyces werraensis]|uniref:helix-turn-helix transcriptional regulator n=1 Tax=Streptomyces werraensis TaxID=68284 RepID=UPI00343A6BD6